MRENMEHGMERGIDWNVEWHGAWNYKKCNTTKIEGLFNLSYLAIPSFNDQISAVTTRTPRNVNTVGVKYLLY